MNEKNETKEPVTAGSELSDGLGGCEHLPSGFSKCQSCEIVELRAQRDRYVAAFEDQDKELEIAVELLEELGQAHEFRCRAYPNLYGRG